MRLSNPAAAALAAAALLVVPVAAAGAAENVDCYECAGTDRRGETDAAHVPDDLLGVPAAHDLFAARGRTPGAGIRVAVVDSGVAPAATGVDVVGATSFAGSRGLVDPHGTVVWSIRSVCLGDEHRDG